MITTQCTHHFHSRHLDAKILKSSNLEDILRMHNVQCKKKKNCSHRILNQPSLPGIAPNYPSTFPIPHFLNQPSSFGIALPHPCQQQFLPQIFSINQPEKVSGEVRNGDGSTRGWIFICGRCFAFIPSSKGFVKSKISLLC